MVQMGFGHYSHLVERFLGGENPFTYTALIKQGLFVT